MPSEKVAQLQHSREFVEKQDATVMRQSPVLKAISTLLGDLRMLTLT